MTKDQKTLNAQILGHDTNDQLLARYEYYLQNVELLGNEAIEHLEMVKEEILKRMNKKDKG